MTLWNQSLCFFRCWQWSSCWMCGIAPQSQIFAVAQLQEPELGWNHGHFDGPCCGTTPKKSWLDGFAMKSLSLWVFESRFDDRGHNRLRCHFSGLAPLCRIQISALNPRLGTASDACMGTWSSAEVLGRYVLMASALQLGYVHSHVMSWHAAPGSLAACHRVLSLGEHMGRNSYEFIIFTADCTNLNEGTARQQGAALRRCFLMPVLDHF